MSEHEANLRAVVEEAQKLCALTEVEPFQPLRDAMFALAEEVSEHVGDIMFNSGDEVDADCLYCQLGVTFGIWQNYGVADPFAPDDGVDPPHEVVGV